MIGGLPVAAANHARVSRTAFLFASLHRASPPLTCLCSVVPFVKSDGADIVLESLLQRAFIKSKAIDVEALCIYTGKRVWRLKVAASRSLPHLLFSSLFRDHALLQVDIRVLENDGNCSDAVCSLIRGLGF